MKVGAVALLRVAGIKHVAVSPARAGLVVFHRREDVVVDRARLVERLRSCPCVTLTARSAGNPLIGTSASGCRSCLRSLLVSATVDSLRRAIQRDAFVARDVVFDVEVQLRLQSLCWFPRNKFRCRISIRGFFVRGRSPLAETIFTSWYPSDWAAGIQTRTFWLAGHVLHRETVVKSEMARILGDDGHGQNASRDSSTARSCAA